MEFFLGTQLTNEVRCLFRWSCLKQSIISFRVSAKLRDVAQYSIRKVILSAVRSSDMPRGADCLPTLSSD